MTTQSSRDPERWTVYGIPIFITDQIDPGTVVAFSMIYEPTEDRKDRYRISAVKVTGIEAHRENAEPLQLPDVDALDD